MFTVNVRPKLSSIDVIVVPPSDELPRSMFSVMLSTPAGHSGLPTISHCLVTSKGISFRLLVKVHPSSLLVIVQ